jgi:hypothetical protein
LLAARSFMRQSLAADGQPMTGDFSRTSLSIRADSLLRVLMAHVLFVPTGSRPFALKIFGTSSKLRLSSN